MIVKAAWIAPVVSPLIKDGFVAWDAGRISGIGNVAELPNSADVEDLGQVILTPGFINAHTHLELTCYAGKLPRGLLWPWIAKLLALRQEAGAAAAEIEADGIARGARDSLSAGVTCVGDISRSNQAWPVLKPLPIRKVCFVELITIANAPPRNVTELNTSLDQVEIDERLYLGISPHAPYTVRNDHIRDAIALASEREIPWTMHYAETPEEIAFLSGDATGLPHPIQQAQQQHNFSAGSDDFWDSAMNGSDAGLLAHANYVSTQQIRHLSKHQLGVAYCPRAHDYFNHQNHPYQKLRSSGVPVCLATDSLASNESLSLLHECKFLRQNDPHHPTAVELLEMITRIPAAALGLSDEIGTLEPGKLADMAAFPIKMGNESALDALFAVAPKPDGVWIAGERVVL